MAPPAPPLPPPDSGDEAVAAAAARTPQGTAAAAAVTTPQGAGAAGPEEEGLDIEDVLYSANSFWAVLKPVALTMFLAALVTVNVAFVSDDQGMSIYTINDGSGSEDGDDADAGDSTSVKLGKSLANALTIVGVICAATFVVVLLYKFRCMKVRQWARACVIELDRYNTLPCPALCIPVPPHLTHAGP